MAASWQTLQNMYDQVRFKAKLTSANLADADLLREANKVYYRVISKLVNLNEGWHGEISTASLVANQQEYTLPTDATGSGYGGGTSKLWRVEVTYDSTNWVVVNPLAWNGVATPTDSVADINNAAQFSTDEPFFSFLDGSVFLFPVPTSSVTNGLRLYWIKRPNELSAGTSVPDMPKELLQLLEDGMLVDIYERAGKLNQSDRASQRFEAGLIRLETETGDVNQGQIPMLKVTNTDFK